MFSKGIFTSIDTSGLSTKEIERHTAQVKYIAAVGSVIAVGFSITLAALKISTELKK